MSCACENSRMGQEYERIRNLAKAWARIEDTVVITYRNEDGTYGFASIHEHEETGRPIVEHITPY